MCKHALQLPKRASNLGCWAELGRLPLMIYIIVAILKFFLRLQYCSDNDLLFYALKSQESLQLARHLTYPMFCRTVLQELNLNVPEVDSSQTPDSIKAKIDCFGLLVKKACTQHAIQIYEAKLLSLRYVTHTKLGLYAQVKNTKRYETI